MPRIIGRAEQDKALKDITSFIKAIPATSTWIEAPNPEGNYSITFKTPEGKQLTTPIICQDKSVLDRLAQAYKESVAQEVAKLAAEHRIELSPEDIEVLGL